VSVVLGTTPTTNAGEEEKKVFCMGRTLGFPLRQAESRWREIVVMIIVLKVQESGD
jgi:hypothetical protein